MVHELKVWPVFYEPLLDGRKTFELRLNDRGFQGGDILRLREWDSMAEDYTGRVMDRRVTYIVEGDPWLAPGYCCMAIEEAW